MTTLRGSHEGRGRRFAVVVARFNETVTAKLLDGALAGFAKHDVAADDLDVAWVPGAFELPMVADRLARSGEYDAVVCLGAVIRGETSHYDFVAGEAAAGIREVSVATGVPCIFGVLTTESLEQAMDRAGGSHGNKGWDAALSALEMAGLSDSLPKPASPQEGALP